MVMNMPEIITEEDYQKLLELGILTQEIGILLADAREKRARQRRLVVDLVQREIISQARASKIAEVQRQTISKWLDDDFYGRNPD